MRTSANSVASSEKPAPMTETARNGLVPLERTNRQKCESSDRRW